MGKLKLYGKPGSPEILPIRNFLEGNGVDFEWIDITNDNLGWGQGITMFNNIDKHAVVEFPDGKVMINPTVAQLAGNLK